LYYLTVTAPFNTVHPIKHTGSRCLVSFLRTLNQYTVSPCSKDEALLAVEVGGIFSNEGKEKKHEEAGTNH
jgi:hypothetical protein